MKNGILKKFICLITLVAFLFTSVSLSYAQSVVAMPAPGTLVGTSSGFVPAIFKGMKVYPKEPLRFDFIIDTGTTALAGASLKDETTKLARYFLASLTTPEEDLWVNLSPYEKDRIIPDAFGRTEMGRDLLAEDYILKQLTSSLMYPESPSGKEVWKKIYAAASAKSGATDIPMDTFNKVWIMPDEATVYVNGNAAVIKSSHLKVMLESDYLAISKKDAVQPSSQDAETQYFASRHNDDNDTQKISKQVLRDVIIPILEKEVNEGANFAQLRQIYHAMVLATWFKRQLAGAIHGSPLQRAYIDKNKVNGIDLAGKDAQAQIWQKYVESFKKGAFNFIKEEPDEVSGETIPRKYFAGGFHGNSAAMHTIPEPVEALAAAVVESTGVVVAGISLQQPAAAGNALVRFEKPEVVSLKDGEGALTVIGYIEAPFSSNIQAAEPLRSDFMSRFGLGRGHKGFPVGFVLRADGSKGKVSVIKIGIDQKAIAKAGRDRSVDFRTDNYAREYFGSKVFNALGVPAPEIEAITTSGEEKLYLSEYIPDARETHDIPRGSRGRLAAVLDVFLEVPDPQFLVTPEGFVSFDHELILSDLFSSTNVDLLRRGVFVHHQPIRLMEPSEVYIPAELKIRAFVNERAADILEWARAAGFSDPRIPELILEHLQHNAEHLEAVIAFMSEDHFPYYPENYGEMPRRALEKEILMLRWSHRLSRVQWAFRAQGHYRYAVARDESIRTPGSVIKTGSLDVIKSDSRAPVKMVRERLWDLMKNGSLEDARWENARLLRIRATSWRDNGFFRRHGWGLRQDIPKAEVEAYDFYSGQWYPLSDVGQAAETGATDGAMVSGPGDLLTEASYRELEATAPQEPYYSADPGMMDVRDFRAPVGLGPTDVEHLEAVKRGDDPGAFDWYRGSWNFIPAQDSGYSVGDSRTWKGLWLSQSEGDAARYLGGSSNAGRSAVLVSFPALYKIRIRKGLKFLNLFLPLAENKIFDEMDARISAKYQIERMFPALVRKTTLPSGHQPVSNQAYYVYLQQLAMALLRKASFPSEQEFQQHLRALQHLNLDAVDWGSAKDPYYTQALKAVYDVLQELGVAGMIVPDDYHVDEMLVPNLVLFQTAGNIISDDLLVEDKIRRLEEDLLDPLVVHVDPFIKDIMTDREKDILERTRFHLEASPELKKRVGQRLAELGVDEWSFDSQYHSKLKFLLLYFKRKARDPKAEMHPLLAGIPWDPLQDIVEVSSQVKEVSPEIHQKIRDRVLSWLERHGRKDGRADHSAAMARTVNGGINLNSKELKLSETGGRVDLSGATDPAMLARVEAGLVPVVVSITPLSDPQAFFTGP